MKKIARRSIMVKITFVAGGLVLLGVVNFAFASFDARQDLRNFEELFSKMKQERHSAVCSAPGEDSASCHARVVTDDKGSPKAVTAPSGYGPKEFHAAYGATVNAASKQIIGIVDAYDDPNIFSDLNKYSNTFGIPALPACSGPIVGSTSPCFQK